MQVGSPIDKYEGKYVRLVCSCARARVCVYMYSTVVIYVVCVQVSIRCSLLLGACSMVCVLFYG